MANLSVPSPGNWILHIFEICSPDCFGGLFCRENIFLLFSAKKAGRVIFSLTLSPHLQKTLFFDVYEWIWVEKLV